MQRKCRKNERSVVKFKLGELPRQPGGKPALKRVTTKKLLLKQRK